MKKKIDLLKEKIYKTGPTIYFNIFFFLHEASSTVYKTAKKKKKRHKTAKINDNKML